MKAWEQPAQLVEQVLSGGVFLSTESGTTSDIIPQTLTIEKETGWRTVARIAFADRRFRQPAHLCSWSYSLQSRVTTFVHSSCRSSAIASAMLDRLRTQLACLRGHFSG